MGQLDFKLSFDGFTTTYFSENALIPKLDVLNQQKMIKFNFKVEEIVSTIVAVYAFVFLEWEEDKAGQEHHILQERKKKVINPKGEKDSVNVLGEKDSVILSGARHL